jgi:hypothetical protein
LVAEGIHRHEAQQPYFPVGVRLQLVQLVRLQDDGAAVVQGIGLALRFLGDLLTVVLAHDPLFDGRQVLVVQQVEMHRLVFDGRVHLDRNRVLAEHQASLPDGASAHGIALRTKFSTGSGMAAALRDSPAGAIFDPDWMRLVSIYLTPPALSSTLNILQSSRSGPGLPGQKKKRGRFGEAESRSRDR